MGDVDFLSLFQGIATLAESEPKIMFGRIFLILLGVALIYLGKKGVLEALLMIPMGLGMVAVNAGVLFFEGGRMGTLFLDPLASETNELMNVLQINWLQPVYTFTFSNGLIACLVFFGIGTLLDVGFVMARPFRSMFLAICAELGTLITFPLGVWLGLPLNQAAATATIGGADGPMVLFSALVLAPEIFVPITVVGYLYLGLTYGGYPYLIKLMVPRSIRGLPMPLEKTRKIAPEEKIVFAVVAVIALCLLFPVAAPLFLALFLGVIIRESGLTHFYDLFSTTVLYGATFFLGLLLGVLCDAQTILDPTVLTLLIIGIVALTFSAIGGLLGGYVLYFASGKKYNPVIGIAGVSCVPTTAKVAQKTVSEVAPESIIMPHALGANISGVITSAIFAAVLITLVRATGQ
ncbi:MAG: sodium ion-translocating decarboxylase subunit beta [Rhodospirillales bacterium]|jgi:oxaloacetate decarboxylase beta subunit|nr:sodium ion-translocating decarboxylase subunit beta [Rhodospirillales bacterium]